MEVTLKGEELNTSPKGSAPEGMMNLDPRLIATILPQILSAVTQPKPTPEEKGKDGSN